MRAGEPEAAVKDVPLRRLLTALAADDPAPGAGAAAGVALALAAACAAKAATISLRHRPGDTDLAAAQSELHAIMGAALQAAEQDGDRFAAWLASHGDHETQALLAAEKDLIRLAQSLDAAISGLRSHIEATLQGDLDAAGSLTAAARSIQARNLRATQRTTGER